MSTNPVASALKFLIGAYQRRISPLFGRRCKYYPTCSGYAHKAIETHGATKGLLLTSWRILRCNPFSDGGVDHPPDRGQWRGSSEIRPE